MNTSTLSNPYWREMRAAVAHAMPHLVWRRHGIGALQAYLSEGTNPEVRVHIWHPKLQTSGMGFPRNVHTHRFDLRSTVLCGVLKQTEFSMGRSDYGGFDIYEVTHARKQGKDELPTRFDGFAYELSGRQVLYPAGSAYFFPRGAFHSTAVDELTVTVIAKLDQSNDEKARIISRVGVQPTHGFTEPLTTKEIDEMVAEAVAILQRPIP